jgi:acetylornithine deacetylase/succinyl-diaminopimelate desuccinylase-like protein
VVNEYQEILDRLHREDPQFNGFLKVMDVSLMEEGFVHEALEVDINHPIVKAAEECILDVTGTRPKLTSFTAWTDGGLLSSYGHIPTIVVGPGELGSAHSAGEYIDVAALRPAAMVYAKIASEFCN